MPPKEKAGKVIFIGNIPYGVSEEMIIDIFSRVGQVVSFRLVSDKDTGRPKGYGFAEYTDHDSAASAVRNLNDHELMGRRLRVDWSNDNGSGENVGDSALTGFNATIPQFQQQFQQFSQMHNPSDAMSQSAQASSTLPPLPPGVDLKPGLTAPDAISQTLTALPAPQLLDIISQMKGLAMQDPAKATELFRGAPQLAYAIFQALLLLGLVDTNVLASVIDTTASAPPPQQPSMPVPPMAQQYPGYPTMQQPGMNVPTPPVQAQAYAPPPQVSTAPQAAQTPDRQQLIQTVLALSQQQIDALPPDQRNQILALKQQIVAGVF